jgi:hypothetical protein
VSLTAEEVSNFMVDDDNAWASMKEQKIVMEMAKKKQQQKVATDSFDYSGLENKKFNMLKKNEMLNRAKNQQLSGKSGGGEHDEEFGEAGGLYGDVVVDGFDQYQNSGKNSGVVNNPPLVNGTFAPKLRAPALQKCGKCSAKHIYDCFSVSFFSDICF